MQQDEKSLFAGIDTSVAGLAKFAGATPPKELTDGLAAISAAVQAAQKPFDTQTDEATLTPLITGLHAVRALRGQLRGDDDRRAAKFEIDFRLRQKEGEFQQAVDPRQRHPRRRARRRWRRRARTAGEGVVIVANHGAADVAVKQVKFDGFDGDARAR